MNTFLRITYFFLIVLLLIRCSGTTSKTEMEQKQITEHTLPSVKLLASTPKSSVVGDSLQYEQEYIFSSDTLTQTLFLTPSQSKKYNIPEKLKFKLILHNKLGKTADTVFAGTAFLSSSTESFIDKRDVEKGSYWAADYKFPIKGCALIITLDIQYYQGCVPMSTCQNLRQFLTIYSNDNSEGFVDVLKRVKN